MRGVCLYFVAQCAFVPTRTVLAKCFSACLLISMAVMLFFSAWLVGSSTGAAGRCASLLGERIPTVRARICRLAEQLRATAGADACWLCRTMFLFASVFVCFVVADVLRTAVASACWSGELLFRIWVGSPANWVSAGRLIGCCFYPLLALLRRDFCFFLDWLLCFISVVGAHSTVFLPVFSRFFLCFPQYLPIFAAPDTGCLFL